MLNPRAPLPLYRQLADELLTAVQRGELGEGARIPSENELAERHRVGRPTVRQATEVLVREGILERRRGSGTFVGKARSAVDLFTLSGTLAAFEGSGVTLQTRVIQRPRLRRVPRQPPQPFAGARALTLTRVGKVGGVPVLLEHLYLDAQLFAGVEEESTVDGSLSLSQWLQARGHQPSGGRQTFRVEQVEGRHADLLAVTRGTPLLVVLRTLDFPGFPSALYARMICRTDRVQLAQTLRADGTTSPHATPTTALRGEHR